MTKSYLLLLMCWLMKCNFKTQTNSKVIGLNAEKQKGTKHALL